MAWRYDFWDVLRFGRLPTSGDRSRGAEPLLFAFQTAFAMHCCDVGLPTSVMFHGSRFVLLERQSIASQVVVRSRKSRSSDRESYRGSELSEEEQELDKVFELWESERSNIVDKESFDKTMLDKMVRDDKYYARGKQLFEVTGYHIQVVRQRLEEEEKLRKAAEEAQHENAKEEREAELLKETSKYEQEMGDELQEMETNWLGRINL